MLIVLMLNLREGWWNPYNIFAGKEDESEIVTEGSAFVHPEPPQEDSSPPKVDSPVEVLNDKVTKQIIKEGHGQKPSKYATCFCK